MANSSLQSVNVAGSARIGGGKYAGIRCAGSAHIGADVEAQSIHCAGSLHAEGSVAGEEVRVSGSAHIGSNLDVGEGNISGSLKVGGGATIRHEAKVSGSVHIAGKLVGEKFRCSGSLHVDEEIALESLAVSGAIECPGMVTADSIRLAVGGWTSHIGELAGSLIEVEEGHGRAGAFWQKMFGEPSGRVVVQEISGDQVRLICTTSKLVRGDEVTIGRGCRIDRVEYRKSLNVDADGFVGESTKVE